MITGNSVLMGIRIAKEAGRVKIGAKVYLCSERNAVDADAASATATASGQHRIVDHSMRTMITMWIRVAVAALPSSQAHCPLLV
jgi:hypothetical protein